MIDLNKGDLVDFGTYGELYVCNPDYSEDYYWVTDEEFNRDNEFADGWSILKDLAKKVVEEYEEEEFDFSDYDLEDEFNNLIANSEDFKEDLEISDVDNENENEKDAEDVMLNEAVSWEYYDNYSNIVDKYLPDTGEGESKASQAVTALNKLIYKWYNDGDVFDNTHYLTGWANDISSYANWLYNNIIKARPILLNISNCYNDSDYEDLLRDLAQLILNDEFLIDLNEDPKIDSVYDSDGPFEFVEYNEDDEYDDDEEYDEYDDEYLLDESYDVLKVSKYDELANKIIDLSKNLDFFDYYNSELDGIDDISDQLSTESGREKIKYWLKNTLANSDNIKEINDILSNLSALSKLEEQMIKESKININKLSDEIKDEVFNTMTSYEFGFEPEEVDNYSAVEITEDSEKIKIEVRAELSYDGIVSLSMALDKIIEKYDKDAYFDMEEPGIITAYIWKQ